MRETFARLQENSLKGILTATPWSTVQILYAKENDIGTQGGGNDGCWRSDAKYEMDWLYDEMRSLSNEVNNIYFESDPTYKMLLKKCDNREFGVWTNVNEVGSKNVLHTHTEDAWAGIYYVQCPPNSGNVIFHKEWARYQNISKPVFQEELTSLRHQWDNVFWEPREGRVILFPSWIGHQVEQNLTNVEGEDGYRISISFNINQVIK